MSGSCLHGVDLKNQCDECDDEIREAVIRNSPGGQRIAELDAALIAAGQRIAELEAEVKRAKDGAVSLVVEALESGTLKIEGYELLKETNHE